MQQLQHPPASGALDESRRRVVVDAGDGTQLRPDDRRGNSSDCSGERGADAQDQLELHVEAVVSTLSRVTDSVADVLKSLHLVTAQLDVIANRLCSQCVTASVSDTASVVCGSAVSREWRTVTNARCSIVDGGSGGGCARCRLPSCPESESGVGGGGIGGCCSGDEGESGYGGESDAPRLSYPSESLSGECGGGDGAGDDGGERKHSSSSSVDAATAVASASHRGELQPESNVSAQGLDEAHELDWDVNGLELTSSSHDPYGDEGGVDFEEGCSGPRLHASDVAAASASAAPRETPQRLSHSFTSPAFSSSYGSLSDHGCADGSGCGGAYEFKVLLLQSLSDHDGWCRGDARPPTHCCRRRQPQPIAAPLYGGTYETQMESALESTALRAATPSSEDDCDDDDSRRGAVLNGKSTEVGGDNDSYCASAAGGSGDADDGCCCTKCGESSPSSEPPTFFVGSAAAAAATSIDDSDARASRALEVDSTDSTVTTTFDEAQPVSRSLDVSCSRFASYDRDVNTWQSFTLSHSDDASDGRATPGIVGGSAASTPRPHRNAAFTCAPQQPSAAEAQVVSPQPEPAPAIPSPWLTAIESAQLANRSRRSKELPSLLAAVAGGLRERRRVRMSERQPVFV